ncbi:cupredoxin domain-containing protein [Roseateles cavernae]|uniref:cupredoxin domain-containing protein n=1 Tax=Roseateles cavernae TaxID=3153578 RepID=UPI0032E37845
MKNIQIRVLLSALALSASLAHAHGPQPHHGGAVKKEQQVFGIAGDAAKVARTIAITMGDDMRFSPDRIEVREGETLRLRIHNQGRLLHELVIGTPKQLDEHAALMQKFPGMEHDEAHMAHVDPGQRGEIVWRFNRAGEFDFACLINGHYQAGMRGKIIVRSAGSKEGKR